MLFSVETETTFEAAHVIPNHPGKCSRMHGHSYRLRITVTGEKDAKTGMVVDFGDMKIALETIDMLFDHRVLNEILPTMLPTAENIASYIFEQLLLPLPGLTKVQLWEGRKHSAIVERPIRP